MQTKVHGKPMGLQWHLSLQVVIATRKQCPAYRMKVILQAIFPNCSVLFPINSQVHVEGKRKKPVPASHTFRMLSTERRQAKAVTPIKWMLFFKEWYLLKRQLLGFSYLETWPRKLCPHQSHCMLYYSRVWISVSSMYFFSSKLNEVLSNFECHHCQLFSLHHTCNLWLEIIFFLICTDGLEV